MNCVRCQHESSNIRTVVSYDLTGPKKSEDGIPVPSFEIFEGQIVAIASEPICFKSCELFSVLISSLSWPEMP